MPIVSVNENCGATVDYTDSTGREWVPDGICVKGGEVRELEGDNRDVMQILRLFTAHKSCYTIGLNKGKRVLIRASFKYGNYDGRFSPPSFDLQLQGRPWDTVDPTHDEDYYTFMEVIYVAQRVCVSVCLVQTKPNNFPFTSALEVINLEPGMYSQVDKNHALAHMLRFSSGSKEDIE